MKFLRSLFGAKSEKANPFQIGRRPRVQGRSFNAGNLSRLTADWNPSVTTGDSEIRYDIVLMRARAREQERNSPFARNYYRAVLKNTLGWSGIALQMKVKDPDGSLDKFANGRIEDAWQSWGKKGNCTVTGQESWRGVQKLALRSAARDGGCLIRLHRNSKLNRFGFALELIEIDLLDVNYNAVLPNGNTVRMGVEKDSWGRPVNYWLLGRHPGENMIVQSTYVYRYPVPAREIIHYFDKERITQSTGFPWLNSASTNLNHLTKYSEAEVVAARAASCKGGFFKSDRGDKFASQTLDDSNQSTNEQQGEGDPLDDFEPNSFDELPAGMDFIPYDPKHPMDAFPAFMQQQALEVGAGGGVSYMGLTGDVSKANYSSMRAGSLDERENYKMWQADFIEQVPEPIFEAWLEMALLSGMVPLPMSRFDKFNAPHFTGRRWAWVDPLHDIQASTMAIDAGLSTRRREIEDNDGGDMDAVFEGLAEEKALAEEKGLEFVTPQTAKVVKGKEQEQEQEQGQEQEQEKGAPSVRLEPSRNGYAVLKE